MVVSMHAQTVHPVLDINEKFIPIESENAISPYMTMIYALDLLENEKNMDEVKRFIAWYVSHMNKVDRFGVSGTVYDYTVSSSGEEHSLDDYDSADGYAGMFIYLVRRYYETTEDMDFVKKIFPELEDSVYLLYHLQDKDGLVKARAERGYETKYLMDNVEAYIGVTSYIFLANVLQSGDREKIDAYSLFKDELKHAMLNQMYDPDTGLYFWAKEGKKWYRSKPTVFYPDMFAQMHLLAFWGNNIPREKAVAIWRDIKILINEKAINMNVFRSHKEGREEGKSDTIAMEQLIIFEWAKRFALKNEL